MGRDVRVQRQAGALGHLPARRFQCGQQLMAQHRTGWCGEYPRRRDEILRLRNVVARRARAMRPCTDSTG
jgi:hypothetical protein